MANVFKTNEKSGIANASNLTWSVDQSRPATVRQPSNFFKTLKPTSWDPEGRVPGGLAMGSFGGFPHGPIELRSEGRTVCII